MTNLGYNTRQEQTHMLGRSELFLVLIIATVLLMNDPRQRTVMLIILLAAMIITAVLPVPFVPVMAASLVTLVALGISDLLKRA